MRYLVAAEVTMRQIHLYRCGRALNADGHFVLLDAGGRITRLESEFLDCYVSVGLFATIAGRLN